VRPVLMLLLGVSCLVAFTLFIMNRPSAWSVFMGGLSIIPIMLFTNLVVLIFRVLGNIVQGNTDAFLSRLSTSPLKVILNIIVVVIVLSVIQAIKKRENNDSGHVK
jgi:F0F1-type ATP synthase assembly protein I